MRITAISDLHGEFPKLIGGDLLIIGGDCTTNDSTLAWGGFLKWLNDQQYKCKILIGGNHDNFLESCVSTEVSKEMGLHDPDEPFEYLKNTGMTALGLQIWGSPNTLSFTGMNPHCRAFTFNSEVKMAETLEKMPENLDILVTHGPPYGILDKSRGLICGSRALLEAVEKKKPRVHIFGHIHGGHGIRNIDPTLFINAAHMNDEYEPVNGSWDIIIDGDDIKASSTSRRST